MARTTAGATRAGAAATATTASLLEQTTREMTPDTRGAASSPAPSAPAASRPRPPAAPSLLQRGVGPFPPRRQRHHRIHVGTGRRIHRHVVGVQPRHHRRVHRIGRAEAPNRNGPPGRSAPGSRSTSPRCGAHWRCASAASSRCLTGRHMFIGQARRSGRKPACISEAIARACARAAASAGHRPAPGNRSARYSRIASDSHTACRCRPAPAPCRCRRSCATCDLKSGAFSEITTSSKAMPATFMAIHGRIDHDE